MLSDLFFIINYWATIASAIIGIFLCLLIIIIIVTHRQCHTVTNVLTCNTCVAITLYFTFRIVTSIYGLRQDSQDYNQPACIFRAYCSLALCTALCYSYSIQAISRLFFAVLYKYKYLLTWRTHCILIAINWLVSVIIPIKPFFHHDGFGYEEESRSCVVTPKIVSISAYVVVLIFVIPLNIVTIVYGVILYRVRQSTRRIAVVKLDTITSTVHNRTHVPNGKRELKIMQNMSAQSTIISCGGILYLILVIWLATQQHSPPPESFYLLALNLISIFTAIMMIALFLMNKPVKKIVSDYIFQLCKVKIETATNRTQTA
ncbi:unnamed protein product [Adineta steineri]|uniref:G-protein coupled receptors family 1 profile domain-containing protein n=1 Tax=Adineta steineri TaxID=433720 RepID=A0A819ZNJ1_9BILA|nr:unnamed protein product [Adineta steineri]